MACRLAQRAPRRSCSLKQRTQLGRRHRTTLEEVLERFLRDSGTKPRRPGLPVEPRRLIWIVADNRKRLSEAILIASVIALVAFFFLPQTHESSAQLLYEGTPELEREGAEPAPDAFIDAAVSPSRLREVRDRLSWDVSLEELESQIEVTLEAEAAMRIVGRATSAERAEGLTRAVLDVFLARQASFNQARLERLTAENEQGLEHAKEKRDEAVAAYEIFRKESGKPDVLEEKKQLLARADLLRTQAEAASVEVVAQQARIGELEKAQKELPRQMVASATRGSPVDSPLAQARSDLASARASLSEQHPRVQALKQRVSSLQAQRKGQKAELGEQTMAVNPARSAVDQQLATARAALAGAKERESALLVLDEDDQRGNGSAFARRRGGPSARRSGRGCGRALQATHRASSGASGCIAQASDRLSRLVVPDVAGGVASLRAARSHAPDWCRS